MHHSRLATVIIDCQATDLDEATQFWSAALGRPALIDPANPRYVALQMQGGEVGCQLQAVTHESRVHLDLETDDVVAEVARLERLGARAVEHHPTWVVMEAPTGQRLCVGRVKSADFPANANRWE